MVSLHAPNHLWFLIKLDLNECILEFSFKTAFYPKPLVLIAHKLNQCMCVSTLWGSESKYRILYLDFPQKVDNPKRERTNMKGSNNVFASQLFLIEKRIAFCRLSTCNNGPISKASAGI